MKPLGTYVNNIIVEEPINYTHITIGNWNLKYSLLTINKNPEEMYNVSRK